MSMKNSPDSASDLQTEPEMESNLSPDATSEQALTIEDALRQASQELPNVALNTTTPKDIAEQEDDFVYVEKPKVETIIYKDPSKSYLQSDIQLFPSPSNLVHVTHDQDTKLPTLRVDPEYEPHGAEINPPILRDDSEHVQHDAGNNPPIMHENSVHVPQDTETNLLTLPEDSNQVTHDAETKPQNLCKGSEYVPQDVGIQTPNLCDKERISPNTAAPVNIDSNTGCSGFMSKKVFFGGVLVGVAIMAVGLIIYKKFKIST